MTRTGWAIIALFVLLGIGLVSMLGGEGPAIQPKTPVVPVIDDPREPADVAPAEIAKIVVPSGLVVPVAGVRPDQLYDSWGDARGGGTRGHQALDIPAPRGTPVLAAAKGRAEQWWPSEAGGTTLYSRSPTGRLSYYYAHLDRYAPGIREGVVVSAGQPSATVGDSGNAGPGNTHLHFGMSLMAPGDNWAG